MAHGVGVYYGRNLP